MTIADYEYMLDTLDKAEHGPLVDGREWDRDIIGKTVKRLVDKYDVHWDRKATAVPFDDELADRLYEAGMEMALSTGVYCIDTRRRMQWSRDEIETAIGDFPADVKVGSGDDEATIYKRVPEDRTRVMVGGGTWGVPIREHLFAPIHEAYVIDPAFDVNSLGTLITACGREIRAGAPMEAVAGWREAQLIIDMLKRVGHEGRSIGSVVTATTAIGELAGTTYGGFRPNELHKNCFLSEQKTSYDLLTKAVHYCHIGAFSEPFCNPMYGGFVGGAYGVAVALVSGLILMRACYQATLMQAGPTHIHLACDTHPDIVTATALAFQALSRNTSLLTSCFNRPVAGPGTKEIFYECAAFTIASVVSGVSAVAAVQSAGGNHIEHISPLEARFCAQLAHAVEGMSRKEADQIVIKIFDLYRDTLKKGLIGRPFSEVYDLDTLNPNPEWLQLYDEVCLEFEQEFSLRLRP